MQDAFEAGQKEIQPDLTSFRHVLLAWNRAGVGSNEKRAAHRAQGIQLPEHFLNYTHSFHILCCLYAFSLDHI